jgi:hypothetical protein
MLTDAAASGTTPGDPDDLRLDVFDLGFWFFMA